MLILVQIAKTIAGEDLDEEEVLEMDAGRSPDLTATILTMPTLALNKKVNVMAAIA